jgi:hypothetical protein
MNTLDNLVTEVGLSQKQILKSRLPAGHMAYPEGLSGPLNSETVVILGWSLLTRHSTGELYSHQWEEWYNGMEAAQAALKQGRYQEENIHPTYLYDWTAGQGFQIEESAK